MDQLTAVLTQCNYYALAVLLLHAGKSGINGGRACGNNGQKCDTRAQCISTNGSSICVCNGGWSGNGVTCSGNQHLYVLRYLKQSTSVKSLVSLSSLIRQSMICDVIFSVNIANQGNLNDPAKSDLPKPIKKFINVKVYLYMPKCACYCCWLHDKHGDALAYKWAREC